MPELARDLLGQARNAAEDWAAFTPEEIPTKGAKLPAPFSAALERVEGESRQRAPEGVRTLELGCGVGELAAMLHGRGHRVVGVDVNAGAVAAASERCPGASFLATDVVCHGLLGAVGAALGEGEESPRVSSISLFSSCCCPSWAAFESAAWFSATLFGCCGQGARSTCPARAPAPTSIHRTQGCTSKIGQPPGRTTPISPETRRGGFPGACGRPRNRASAASICIQDGSTELSRRGSAETNCGQMGGSDAVTSRTLSFPPTRAQKLSRSPPPLGATRRAPPRDPQPAEPHEGGARGAARAERLR
ncbi:unnamed protein product [Prorocentrum cordatum]|uniref:Methyltransferase domain-containing protein n=1 Tax=Prorocentrum cordatum TaxID=2364126 RepID=A0ABN9Q7R8_9DINO|nr:unnamed protein product [Polarella glacialis]